METPVDVLASSAESSVTSHPIRMDEPHLDAAPPVRPHLACVSYAVFAVALMWTWQAVKVHSTYGGNWTALYSTSSELQVPPALEHENIYRLPKGYGYDGQFYHYIAHDPWLQRGLSSSIDNPRLRYRRILLPGLAYLAAFGREPWIDPAYYLVTLLFVFLGVYWVAAYAARGGHHPAYGFLFLLVPAVLISLNRLTVDIALAALCAGYALYSAEKPSWKLYLVLMLAPLARETGICLPVAYLLYSAWQRWIAPALLTAAATLPSLGWWLFIDRRTPSDPSPWISWPFHGLLNRIVNPPTYSLPLPALEVRILSLSEYAALAGIVLAFLLSAWFLVRRTIHPTAIACCGFLLIGMLLGNPDAWTEFPGYGRTFSPLLMLLPLEGLPSQSWLSLVPLALTLPWTVQKFLVLALRFIG